MKEGRQQREIRQTHIKLIKHTSIKKKKKTHKGIIENVGQTAHMELELELELKLELWSTHRAWHAIINQKPLKPNVFQTEFPV